MLDEDGNLESLFASSILCELSLVLALLFFFLPLLLIFGDAEISELLLLLLLLLSVLKLPFEALLAPSVEESLAVNEEAALPALFVFVDKVSESSRKSSFSFCSKLFSLLLASLT